MSLSIILSLIIAAISFLFWLKVESVRKILKHLDWVAIVPGNFLFGNGLDFEDSTGFLPTISGYVRKYGKLTLFRIGPLPMLIITDYDFLEFLLTSTKILTKSDNYLFLKNWLETGLLTAPGQKWKDRRKIINPTFHFQILEQFVETFDVQSRIMVKNFEKELGGNGFDVTSYVSLCTLDIICETVMGTSVKAQSNENSDYVKACKEMGRIIMKRSFSPLLVNDFIYKLSSEYANEKKCLKMLHSQTNYVINTRRKELKMQEVNGISKEDDTGVKKKIPFLDMLLQANINGKELTDSDVREEVDTFMFAGHDTTTSGVSFALYMLATHPEVQQRAFEEQKEVLGDDMERCLTMRDLQSMKYLECILKESLRQYPPAPFYARKVTEEVQYKGHIVPKGLTLFIYAYGVNNDPDNFENPEKFDPSRWENADGRSPYSYLVFSAGPRNCVGQKFAMLEMKAMLSRVLRAFELRPVPGHRIVLAAETVLKSKTGLKIQLKKRLLK